MQMTSLQETAPGIIDSEWFMHQASCASVIGPRALVLILKKKGQKLLINQLGSLCIVHIQTTALQILKWIMNLGFLASEKGWQ